jgi:glycerol uptake facilitator-like aquaporin
MAVNTRPTPLHAMQALAMDFVVFVGLVGVCLMEGRSLDGAARRLVVGLRVGLCCVIAVLLLGGPTSRALALGGVALLLSGFGRLTSVANRASAALLVGAIGCWVLGLTPLRDISGLTGQ